MPISFRCPHCQMKLSAPDHAAKQSFSCPNCKGTFALPSVSVQQKQPAPTVPAQQPAQQIFAGLQEAGSSTTEASEPWFFRFISFFAYLIIGIGIAVFAIGLLVLAFIFLKVPIETRGGNRDRKRCWAFV